MKDFSAVLQTIQVTEKGTRLKEQQGKYFFRVHPAANKMDVRRAVERHFKVHVTKVNVMNYQGKKRRERTPSFGRTAAWKRAIVTLKAGEKIDFT